jgi:hypothetical protein
MKEIIAAIDGLKYAEGPVKYGISLALQCNAHLTGVFREDFTSRRYKIQDSFYKPVICA